MIRLLICTATILALTASANAQPYGGHVTAKSPMRQGVNYSMDTPTGRVMLRHLRDGKTTLVTTADGQRSTLVAHACGSDWCIYRDGRLWRRNPR
jgi:hypothetical protein